jgi:hypothetical protein
MVRIVISLLSARLSTFALLTLLFVQSGQDTLRAQDTAGLLPGLNASLVRLVGDHKSFKARLEVRIVNGQGRETFSAPMKFSLLDGKMRGDLDVTRLKSKDLPALAGAAAKSVGMEQVIILVRPDKKETYLLYPAFKACIVAPMDPEDLAALEKPAKILKTPLGNEVVDGHPCVKNKVVVNQPDGITHEAIVWRAADLKGFPLIIQTTEGADTLVLHFHQVRFEKPDAKVFDLPASTDKYDDPQDLTRAVIKKLIGEALGGAK